MPPYSFTPGALKTEGKRKRKRNGGEDAQGCMRTGYRIDMHHSRHLQIVFGEGTNGILWLGLALLSTI
jgi:hypothetical protein